MLNWYQALREQRLQVILEVLNGQAITLIIDETGDRKKGQTTAYVKRQYISNLGKIENGIVAVTAYGVWKNMTLPLAFEVYKPHTRLEPGDVYQSKPQIAAGMIRELQAVGFEFQLNYLRQSRRLIMINPSKEQENSPQGATL